MANFNIQSPVYAWETPYVSGLGLSYVGNTTFNVAAGTCTDSTATNVITLDAVNLISSAVTGAGGLDTGTIAATTLYYVYAIGNSASYDAQAGSLQSASTGGIGTYVNPFPGAALISLNAPSVGPYMPKSYDMFRYIGCVRTDGSSHFLNFVQFGTGSQRVMWYDAGISALSGGSSATYAAVSLANIVPVSVAQVNILATFTPTGAGNALDLIPYGSTSTTGYAQLSGSVAAVATTANMAVPAGLNSLAPTIQYKVVGSATSLLVAGYVDQL